MSESDYRKAVSETQRESCSADEPDRSSAPPIGERGRRPRGGEEQEQPEETGEAAIPPESSGGDTCEGEEDA